MKPTQLLPGLRIVFFLTVFGFSGSCSFPPEDRAVSNGDDPLWNEIAALKNALQYEPDHKLNSYNLACFYSLLGEADSAFKYLDRAMELGYTKLSVLIDPDLEELSKHKEWNKIEEQIHEY